MNRLNRLLYQRWCWILTGAAVVYFMAFPEDIGLVLAPIKELLQVSLAISPWLYGLIAVGMICWTLRSIFAPRWQRGNHAPPE